MYAQFIEDDIYYDFIKSLGLSKAEYSGENAKMIAVASVFNIISTNIWLRHRGLVMLRSAGMSAHGFSHMVNSECFFYGLRTLLFGVPLATAFSWLIYKGIVFSQQLRISLITSHWQV